VLDETNVLALFPEALTADVQAILADQTGFVGADADLTHPQTKTPQPSLPTEPIKSRTTMSQKPPRPSGGGGGSTRPWGGK